MEAIKKRSLGCWLVLGLPLVAMAQVAAPDSVRLQQEQAHQDSIQWEMELANVTVKATRSQYRQKNGALVARISGTSLEKEPTATDVLCKLPGMMKNKDGKPQAFIGGAPEIYINDRKVQDYSVVENLPVTQIKEVKVIHHPGAEYGNDVGCVLLITTKKHLEGLAIVENSGIGIDSYVSNQHDLDVTFSQGRLTYYGKVGYANGQGCWKETDAATNYDSHTYLSSSTLDNKHNTTDRFYWSAGTDWAVTKQQTIGFKYDGYRVSTPIPYHMTSFTTTDDRVDDKVEADNKFSYYDWQHHVNAFYQGHYSEKWKLDLFADYVKVHTQQGQTVDELSEKSGQRNAFFLLPQSNGTVWGAKAKARHTFSDKASLIFGAECNYVKSESFATYTPADKGVSTHSVTKENHAAAFAEYALDFHPFSLTVGLRYEHVASRLDHLDDTGTSIHRNSNRFYPSFSLSHQAGRFSQTLSYRSSETRPTFFQLNTGMVYANRYLRQMGNDQLQPSQRHEVQYQATYRDFFLQASYTYVKDYITFILKPFAEEPQMGYITWDNVGHCWNWGAFVGYRHRWGWYEPQVQTGIQQGFIRATYLGTMKSFHDPYYIFNIYNGFHLPKGWYINLSYSYRSSGTYDYLTICSVNTFQFQVYKSFLKDRLSLSLNVNDLFNQSRQHSDGIYGNMRFQQNKWSDTRNIELRLTWRLNHAKKQYGGESTTDEAVGRMGR